MSTLVGNGSIQLERDNKDFEVIPWAERIIDKLDDKQGNKSIKIVTG